jgi:hypothetical protein
MHLKNRAPRETHYQRIERLVRSGSTWEEVALNLLDVVQKLEDRLARFEEHYKNNGQG